MLVLVLFIVVMAIWFLTLLPPLAQFAAASPWLAFLAVTLLGIAVFAGRALAM